MRVSYASPPMDDVLRDRGIACEEHVAPGHLGDPLEVSVLRPPGQDGPRPAVVYAHSGGLMFGDRFSGIDLVLDWVDRMGAILVTVEYRLAPEFPTPIPAKTCTRPWNGPPATRTPSASGRTGWSWPARAPVADWPPVWPWQHATVAAHPWSHRSWTTRCSTTAHHDVDAPVRRGRGVGPGQQPDGVAGTARGHLWNRGRLPVRGPVACRGPAWSSAAFIDVGAAEVFRDEAIAYADALWRAGGDAELHVWSGAFHACDIFAPHTAVGQSMIKARNTWLETILAD